MKRRGHRKYGFFLYVICLGMQEKLLVVSSQRCNMFERNVYNKLPMYAILYLYHEKGNV